MRSWFTSLLLFVLCVCVCLSQVLSVELIISFISKMQLSFGYAKSSLIYWIPIYPFPTPLFYPPPPSIPHKHNSNVLIINSSNCIIVNVCRCKVYRIVLYIYMHFNLNTFCCTIDFAYFFLSFSYSLCLWFIHFSGCLTSHLLVFLTQYSHWNEQLDCIQLLSTTSKAAMKSSCVFLW